VTGTYQWDAFYSGDSNNSAASDDNAVAEQVTVSAASPTITTTPNPSSAMLGGRLQDLADISGGFSPTGSITFRLYAPGVDPTVGPATYTENVTGVNGNGAYSTTVGFASNVAGTWHWVASYNGDSNNNPAPNGPLDEPVTIPQPADLVLMKQVTPTTVIIGMDVTYTFILHNSGPGTAVSSTVTDPFPAGVTFVSAAVPSQGSFNPATHVWTVGDLANGATATLQIVAQVTLPGPIVNNAQAATVSLDPDLSNNTATAMISGLLPAGQISKRLFLASSDPAVPDLNSAVSFVTNLYNAVLNRAPDLAGADAWESLFMEGVSRQTIVQRLWNSPEHLGMEVDRLYAQTLHRSADPGGRAAWVNYLTQGHGENDLDVQLLTSGEYMATHSSSSSFVQGLYADVLQRTPDSLEVSGWLAALQATADRALIANSFVNSAEAITNAINVAYMQFLLRPADTLGRNAWLAAEQSGSITLEQVEEAILASDEFFLRA
jgi:uncharacterized repeat protein (TIGR01451 family)